MTEKGILETELAKPIYLYKQIPEISRITGLEETDIKKIMMNSLIVEKHKGSYILVSAKQLASNSNGQYYGSDAITYLLNLHKKAEDVIPLFSVIIPYQIFGEATPREWYDITYLFSRVKNRSDRLKRLTELSAPTIIMLNEERMLWEAITSLEDNDNPVLKPLVDYNDIMLRSLNDMEYSLLTGWSEEKRKRMEDWEEGFKNSMEESEGDKS